MLDFDKVKANTTEVAKALTSTFRRFSHSRGGMDMELFQGIVNGSISALTSIAYTISPISQEQARELAASTITHFSTKLVEFSGGSVKIIDGGVSQYEDDDRPRKDSN